MEYGFIDNGGYLTSRQIEESANNFYIIVQNLEKEGWKPVDDIDSTQIVADDPSCIVVPIPYYNGDRISFRYLKKFDYQAIKNKIIKLQEELASSDYKIIKCYESFLVTEDMPYDIHSIHVERQNIRDKINELKALLNA